MKKACRFSGKIKFDSHERAAIRAGEILNKPANRAPALWTYLCRFCGKWHLTSHGGGKDPLAGPG